VVSLVEAVAAARVGSAVAETPGLAERTTAWIDERAFGTVDVVPGSGACAGLRVDRARTSRPDEVPAVSPDQGTTMLPGEARASRPDEVVDAPLEEARAPQPQPRQQMAAPPPGETEAPPPKEVAAVSPDDAAEVLPDDARKPRSEAASPVLPEGVAAALAAAQAAVDPAGRFPFRMVDEDEDEHGREGGAGAGAGGERQGDGTGERQGDGTGERQGDGEAAAGAPAGPVEATPGGRVGTTPGGPVGATPGGPVGATPDAPVSMSASSASATPSGSAQVVDLRLEVDDLRPGPELAALVTAIDPASASDELLADLVGASERVAAWARASSAALAAELSRRASMQTPVLKPRDALTPVQCTATELSMRLACSPFAAARLTRMGRAMTGMLTATGAAFANGRIDERRAQVITDALAELPGPVAWDVEDRVLDRASTRTVVEVRSDVQRALVAVDPAEAVARARQARRTRRVEAPRRQADGMATLIAVLPAPQATGIYRVLDAAARTARAAGDPRTLEQLRADGLCDLTLGDDLTPAGHTALLRDARTPAEQSSPLAGDRTSAGQPALHPDDRTPADQPPPLTGDRTSADGVPVPDARWAGCGHDRPARHRPAVVTRVTMPLSTLLGVDDQPADLEGYGAIDPVTARALAAGGVFQRMVTDPLSGTLLDLGRTTYRPSAALAEHVQARDGTCRHPACSVPAGACDLDHTRDYHREPDDGGPPGTTSHDNLGPLCRRHHRMKSEAGFRLRQTAPGRFEWLTPTGHHYAVPEHLVAPPPEPVPDTEPDPPPF
jgi:hypothetical protein